MQARHIRCLPVDHVLRFDPASQIQGESNSNSNNDKHTSNNNSNNNSSNNRVAVIIVTKGIVITIMIIVTSRGACENTGVYTSSNPGARRVSGGTTV